MKNKEIKKIAKQIYKQIKLEREQPKGEVDRCDWSEYDPDVSGEYDPDVSDKFKKMFLQIIEYKENLRINITDSNISIYIQDIKNLKSDYSSKLNSEEDYLEISIIKDVGYSISKGYRKKSQFRDKDIFNQLESLVKDRLSKINKENFNDIWENIMLESGLVRDNNLLDILEKD